MIMKRRDSPADWGPARLTVKSTVRDVFANDGETPLCPPIGAWFADGKVHGQSAFANDGETPLCRLIGAWFA
jgi:hypothetical protein